MNTKKHFASMGIVASANLDTVYQREIFFQVDPMSLDWIDHNDIKEVTPSGFYVDLQPEQFLPFLPELEAEIFWLIYYRQKNQKDIAQLLKLSQPTVSYRYRRTLAKLNYLITLMSLEPRRFIDDLFFLKAREKDILFDLLFYMNQEMVGKKYGVRQSSVKWLYVKSKRKLEELERRVPEKWFNHLGLLIFLGRNLNIRVLH